MYKLSELIWECRKSTVRVLIFKTTSCGFYSRSGVILGLLLEVYCECDLYNLCFIVNSNRTEPTYFF